MGGRSDSDIYILLITFPSHSYSSHNLHWKWDTFHSLLLQNMCWGPFPYILSHIHSNRSLLGRIQTLPPPTVNGKNFSQTRGKKPGLFKWHSLCITGFCLRASLTEQVCSLREQKDAIWREWDLKSLFTSVRMGVSAWISTLTTHTHIQSCHFLARPTGKFTNSKRYELCDPFSNSLSEIVHCCYSLRITN